MPQGNGALAADSQADARRLILLPVLPVSQFPFDMTIAALTAGLAPDRAFLHGMWIYMSAWSTGGFAPMSQNILYYHSEFVELATIVFFVIGSFNFALHHAVLSGRRGELRRNLETITFTITLTLLTLITTAGLMKSNVYPNAAALFRKGFYQLISGHTTTGFMTIYAKQFYHEWGDIALFAMVIAMLLGGSACSTAGGFKALRTGIIFTAFKGEIKRMLLPESRVSEQKIHHIKDVVLSDSMAPFLPFRFPKRRKFLMTKPLVLVVEDDKPVRNLISLTLETQGYRYKTAEKGSEAVMAALSHQPDLIILDLGLPDMDGVDVIKKTRTWSNMPIIVVSARSEDSDKIAALDAGADDYLTKPFSVDELLARLRVAFRRLQFMRSTDTNSTVFINGGLKIDYAAGCTYIDGDEVHLSPIEYKLICLMSRNVGKVLTHNSFLKEIWQNTLPNDTPSLRVYIATLRKKIETPLGQKLIQTHV